MREHGLELVRVFETGDILVLALVKGALESEGIPFVTQGEGLQDLIGFGRIGGSNLVTGPVRIHVASRDVERALQIVADIETP